MDSIQWMLAKLDGPARCVVDEGGRKMLSIAQIKKGVIPLAESYGVKSIALFGSYARGDQDAKSDLDLLVELGTPMGLFRFTGLQLDLEDAFRLPVDLCTPDSLEPGVLASVLKEKVELYERPQ